MHVNFLRTGVGHDSVGSLAEFQKNFRLIRIDGGKKGAVLMTRRTPTRTNDLVNGGSVYWIINRFIQARQEIIDVETLKDEDDKPFCRIIMNPEIIMLSPMPHRHIQGWRYLTSEKAPRDLGIFDPKLASEMEQADPKMTKALQELGLL